MPDIEIDVPTVFSLPSCVQCRAVKRKLDTAGIEYQEIDASESPEAYDLITKEWGYSAAPVTYFKGKHFSGFNPYELDDIVSQFEAVAA